MPRTTSTLSRPPFVADRGSINKNTGRQIAWEYITDAYRYGSATVQANGAAAAAATSITVDALPIALDTGTLLHFGGSGEFARLTAPAAAGATTITVEALPNGIEDNDTATVMGTGSKSIPAGKVMAEMTDGRLVTRAERPGAETASCILETPAVEDDPTAAKTGYGCMIGGVLFENLLPDASGSPAVLPADYKTELQAAGVGTGFAWERYEDSLAV